MPLFLLTAFATIFYLTAPAQTNLNAGTDVASGYPKKEKLTLQLISNAPAVDWNSLPAGQVRMEI